VSPAIAIIGLRSSRFATQPCGQAHAAWRAGPVGGPGDPTQEAPRKPAAEEARGGDDPPGSGAASEPEAPPCRPGRPQEAEGAERAEPAWPAEASDAGRLGKLDLVVLEERP